MSRSRYYDRQSTIFRLTADRTREVRLQLDAEIKAKPEQKEIAQIDKAIEVLEDKKKKLNNEIEELRNKKYKIRRNLGVSSSGEVLSHPRLDQIKQLEQGTIDRLPFCTPSAAMKLLAEFEKKLKAI